MASGECCTGGTHAASTLAGHLRIVLVEDDDDARELLRMILVEAGVTVRVAASAAEALVAVSEMRPHLLIADIGLPGEDGYALIRNMRAGESERGGHVPAIAVTAYASDADRSHAIAAASMPISRNRSTSHDTRNDCSPRAAARHRHQVLGREDTNRRVVRNRTYSDRGAITRRPLTGEPLAAV